MNELYVANVSDTIRSTTDRFEDSGSVIYTMCMLKKNLLQQLQPLYWKKYR